MTKYYTLIGSRSTPSNIMDLLVRVANKLACQGWVGRSGGADGADSCLEAGCIGLLATSMEIYVPWKNFNNRVTCNTPYIDASCLPNREKAEEIASNIHPAWERCSRGAKGLHTRNVYQILGKNLSTPSKFVLCWAKPSGKDGNVVGGTGTAVRLALENNIPVYNLYYDEVVKKMEDYLI